MKTPLRRNPIFWVVLLYAVIALDFAQMHVARKWLNRRFVAIKTAKRMEDLPVQYDTFVGNPALAAQPDHSRSKK